jgi:RimJ/RimL family protein N-acetyltransferase
MKGSLVRLAAFDPHSAGEHFARWRGDSEYARLLDAAPQQLATVAQTRKWAEAFSPGDSYRFLIRVLADDHVIGFVNLWPDWLSRDVWIGIGIGDRAERGRGYGTDAMRLALRFAFEELEMDRASLGVYADNERAWRAYQRAGFLVEGRQREMDLRDGRRWDDLIMGILREDWRAVT